MRTKLFFAAIVAAVSLSSAKSLNFAQTNANAQSPVPIDLSSKLKALSQGKTLNEF